MSTGFPGNSTEAAGAARRPYPPARLAWLIWGLGATLYLIAFFQRVAPAVITRELSSEFALSAASLGNLSAFYFYSYAAIQIPTGILADRWGPRRMLTLGAAITAVGTLLFAAAPNVEVACAGRLAIGAAAGVAFVSVLKLATHWMPSRRFALASGVALFVGVLGATFAGAPLRVLVDEFGWRPVMFAAALVTALVAMTIWFVARDDPSERGYASYFPHDAHAVGTASVAAHLREVLRYRNTWLLLVIPGALSGIPLSFGGLWGVPYLVSVHGFTAREAAGGASAMLIAWSVGSMACGPISERMGARKPLYAAGIVATLALWAVVVFAPWVEGALLVAILIAVGLVSSTFILNFAFAKESVPARLGGTVSGIANMGVMLGGMVMQPLVGVMLDLRWDGRMSGGARVYDAAAYQWGFGLMLVWCVAALALLAFTRESHCRPHGS